MPTLAFCGRRKLERTGKSTCLEATGQDKTDLISPKNPAHTSAEGA
ncbi:MAG: hypothetical protein ABI158_10435 [Edaphobacter sp.]